MLQRLRPDDAELAVAGLVHDVGHLLPGGRDETPTCGRLRPPCARHWGNGWPGSWDCTWRRSGYLVAVESGYGGELAADSVSSLAHQGGAMGPDEVAAFLARPFAADAVALRRADDNGKDDDAGAAADAEELRRWAVVLRRVGALGVGDLG